MTVISLAGSLPRSPADMPADERERRVRAADRERGEAALTLASGDHKLGTGGACCPVCKGPVVIGATVRVVHAASCARRVALEKTRKAAAEGKTLRRPARVQARVAKPKPALGPCAVEQPKTPAFQHVNRHPHQRGRNWAPQASRASVQPPRCRIRTSVIQAWQVRGCRVRVGSYAATVTGPIRQADTDMLIVPVAFDDGWDPEDVRIAVDNGKLVTELAAA